MGGKGVTESLAETPRTTATTHHNESDTSTSTLSTPSKDSPMRTVRATPPLRLLPTTHSRRLMSSPLGRDTPPLPVLPVPTLASLGPARQGRRLPPSFAGRRLLRSALTVAVQTHTGDVVDAAGPASPISVLRVRLPTDFPLLRWSPDRGSTAILPSAFHPTLGLDEHSTPGIDHHRLPPPIDHLSKGLADPSGLTSRCSTTADFPSEHCSIWSPHCDDWPNSHPPERVFNSSDTSWAEGHLSALTICRPSWPERNVI
ncbi:hypothetical protein SAMN04488691_1102 [Haloferax larsenii]|uniref:Uncharacterized protein n=1 Tax=Haloferax larsenii TaxID=302484 RepID=A0A1H7TPR5_HALLR|nr:hypothetical protein SAMN04488691_1102 [Haloferax larsenii]